VGGDFVLDETATGPDPLLDDQASYVDTSEGLVILLGCAHSGVINTIRYIQELTQVGRVRLIAGGMHLVNASPERLNQTVAELRRCDAKHLLPCHCTGFAATNRLWNDFPGRCQPCPTGTVIALAG
jgi:7,8-dihydropterin-6-yl-methyl-4-(beta-D-ribofuranosyl)aminobenzene 5'-phosphate synthase